MPTQRVTENRKLGEQASTPVPSAHETSERNITGFTEGRASSAAPSPGEMRTRVMRAAQGVICFDDDERVIIVTSQAEKFTDELFACTPVVGEVLPQPLRQCTADLRDIPPATLEGPPRRDFRKEGHCVSISLAIDPQGNFHCLIFERKKEVTTPEQLQKLGLSPRETLVTFWILHQKTNWEIGKILQISTRTVDKHVERIFLKLQVNDRRDLVLRARELCAV